jgi:hypothetical protein
MGPGAGVEGLRVIMVLGHKQQLAALLANQQPSSRNWQMLPTSKQRPQLLAQRAAFACFEQPGPVICCLWDMCCCKINPTHDLGDCVLQSVDTFQSAQHFAFSRWGVGVARMYIAACS